MHRDLTLDDRGLQTRARALVDRVLAPLEHETDDHGSLPERHWAAVKDAVRAHNLNAINHRREHGGQGLSLFQQTLVNEQLGRLTCGLYATVWHPAIPLARGTPQQIEKYLVPTCRGEIRDCFAITEEGAGSDPRQVRTAALPRAGGWLLTGRKWHVTSFSGAAYIIVHAHANGDPEKPTLFLVEKSRAGIRHVRSPKYMHTWPFDHAEIEFDEVRLEPEDMLGEVGQGFELTKEWFIETRLTIAARWLARLREQPRWPRISRARGSNMVAGLSISRPSSSCWPIPLRRLWPRRLWSIEWPGSLTAESMAPQHIALLLPQSSIAARWRVGS